REQLVVGNRAPQEERQARGDFDVGETIRRAVGHVRGIALNAEDEFGARENAAKREIDAGIEASAFFASVRVKLLQHLQVGGSHVAAIRVPRESRQDLL